MFLPLSQQQPKTGSFVRQHQRAVCIPHPHERKLPSLKVLLVMPFVRGPAASSNSKWCRMFSSKNRMHMYMLYRPHRQLLRIRNQTTTTTTTTTSSSSCFALPKAFGVCDSPPLVQPRRPPKPPCRQSPSSARRLVSSRLTAGLHPVAGSAGTKRRTGVFGWASEFEPVPQVPEEYAGDAAGISINFCRNLCRLFFQTCHRRPNQAASKMQGLYVFQKCSRGEFFQGRPRPMAIHCPAQVGSSSLPSLGTFPEIPGR